MNEKVTYGVIGVSRKRAPAFSTAAAMRNRHSVPSRPKLRVDVVQRGKNVAGLCRSRAGALPPCVLSPSHSEGHRKLPKRIWMLLIRPLGRRAGPRHTTS